MLDRVACGELPRKHHLALRGPDAHLRYEHCLTREGFEGPYTISYHLFRPHVLHARGLVSGWAAPLEAEPGGLLRRHYRTRELVRTADAPALSRTPLLFNADLVLGCAFPQGADPAYFSNADADDLFFVLEGGGVLESSLGDVRFTSGDYVFVPKGLLYRFVLDPAPQHWLTLESSLSLRLPKQWRNAAGQLRMDAPYSHRDFRRPVFSGPRDHGSRDLIVKRQGAFHRFESEHTLLDVVGWDGAVYPFAFAIRDFQPRVGLVHLPPSWHGTFATDGALICSFVPRPLDFHPDAVRCPYPHSSVDVDEVLFYCAGQFTSRKGVGVGSLSHHPAGIPHGPHPGAYEGSLGTPSTDELAVMLDCYKPLARTTAAAAIEDANYHESFG